jgi:hypothetical protein
MSTPTGEPVYIRFQRLFNRYRFHYEHQDGLCFYCCQPMAMHDPARYEDKLPPDRVTVEHLVNMIEARRNPHHRRHDYHPAAAACHVCNKKRGGKTSWQGFLTGKIARLWKDRKALNWCACGAIDRLVEPMRQSTFTRMPPTQAGCHDAKPVASIVSP